MNLSLGIIGLPNVGKSTLFNALLKKQAALVANYPFATIEPNVGVVEVPDERLQGLVEVVRNDYGQKMGDREVPQKIIPSTVKFYDIAGLVKGAHKGEGLGNEFLGHIREVSALVHVIRDFEDDNIIRSGAVNPQEDVSTIDTELILADISILDRILRGAKDDAKSKDVESLLKVLVLEKISSMLNNGRPARELVLGDKEEKVIRGINLLTRKPILYVYNVSENNLSKYLDQSNQESSHDKLYISAKIESEICSLSENEQREYLREMGMKEPGLNRLIKAGYQVLGLQDFLTAGPKEVRAWTIRIGARAPEAAGVIHTDFERGFIGADVISYIDLMRVKSLKKAREFGLIRLEGKNYFMKDGDVVEFRFNV
ncbi:MAG: redox-regulated ATPase YchF [Patescibacteria group bacterium]